MVVDDIFAGLFRARGNHHHRVTLVELFFDLVYVFAIGQLSHLLLEHLTWRGAFQTLLLLCAMWWTWIYTTWFTNWLNPDRLPVRLVLLAIMLICLIMSAMVPDAFGERGLPFGVGFALVHSGPSLFMILASRDDPGLRRNYQRILPWLVVSSALWVAGGLVSGGNREVVWLAALVVQVIGPMIGFFVPGLGRSTTHDWATISGGLLAERCQLFLIIAFGETILLMGATLSGHEITASLMTAFIVAFIGTVALWWVYFGEMAERAAERIAESDDPGRLARSAYTYIHLLLVGGIIVTAVGDELSMAHPTEQAGSATAIMLLGGPALFLLGQQLFKFAVWGYVTRPRMVAIALLLVFFPIGRELPAVACAIAATVVLIGVILMDARYRRTAAVAGLQPAVAFADLAPAALDEVSLADSGEGRSLS